MIDLVLKCVIPIVCSAIVAFLTKLYKDSKSMKNGVLALLWNDIVDACEKWNDKGFIPQEARVCLNNLVKQYTSLGGNHGVDQLVIPTLKLPLKPSYNRRKDDN